MTKLRFAAIAAAALLALPGLAHAELDIAAMKAHQTPASDTLQAAQICTAMSMAYAFMYSDSKDPKDKDNADSYTVLTKLWLGIAAEKSGMSYDDYLDKQAIDDMKSLTQLQADDFDFYDAYCNKASREIIEAAHKQ